MIFRFNNSNGNYLFIADHLESRNTVLLNRVLNGGETLRVWSICFKMQTIAAVTLTINMDVTRYDISAKKYKKRILSHELVDYLRELYYFCSCNNEKCMMMKNKKFFYFSLWVILLVATGCTSARKIAYLKGAGEGDDAESLQSTPLYDAHILPKDLITITISATNPEAVQPFNLTVPSRTTGLSTYSQPQLMPYLVDNNGQVNFPVLGMITLGGLTKREAELKIADLLGKYLKETPVVNVSFVNYKISVLGEVNRPNTFTISNEKVTVFEALAMAGDMTIWGQRHNVKIIREDAYGNKQVALLNLNDKEVIYSPYYYLQQNDVVYVQPNKTKAKNSEIGSATGIWLSATSILVSVATLVLNVIRLNN